MMRREVLLALAETIEGVPVLDTLRGSPAARAGIRYGDVLLSVNGRRTRNLIEMIEARNAHPDRMVVRIFRLGEERVEHLDLGATSTPTDPRALLAELLGSRVVLPPPDEP